jgi:outer membrane protein assembly factor BamD (BamD/ComL family)
MANTSETTPLSKRFEQAVLQYVQWIRTHQEQFWSIFGTVAAALILVVFMIHRRQTENENAWVQLGVAQGYLLQGQMDQATKALDQWTTRYQGTEPATYAKFLRADLLYRTSDYTHAAVVYGDLAQAGQPPLVRPMALSAQSAADEMAGDIPQALALTQQFLDRYPDHFLTASMYISQARLSELSGNPANASALYDRFVILYPQSPWTAFAHARLQALSGHTTPPPLQK